MGKKRQKAWNKGLTKETDERVAKHSKSLIGHIITNETREKISKANKGRKAWNKGLNKFQHPSIKSISEKLKNRKFTEEWRKRISESKKGQVIWSKGLTKETNESIRKGTEKMVKTRKRLIREGKYKLVGCALKGDKNYSRNNKIWSKGLTKKEHPSLMSIARKLSKSRKGKSYEERLGKKKAKIYKDKIGRNSREMWSKHEFREKMSEIHNNNWNNPEYKEKVIKNILRGLMKRPTSFEKKIIDLCTKYKLPFNYSGDGRILIGLKNPDFIDEDNKMIIEVFLDYFKIRDYGSIENYMKIRGEHFANYGYKTIFINEKEIQSKKWEDICLKKIKKCQMKI